jgi:peptide deformylase
MKILKLTRFGNPILRETARRLSPNEIKSDVIQQLITDIKFTNEQKQYGVGLAAPQVGEPVALSVIGIKPTPTRPNLESFDQVIINPSYEGIGHRSAKWEGCQSSGAGRDTLFGKALRYSKIRAKWYDENAEFHDQELSGIKAHVFQHETDHLNGILFVDRVRDTKTFMLADEYRKRIVKKR